LLFHTPITADGAGVATVAIDFGSEWVKMGLVKVRRRTNRARGGERRKEKRTLTWRLNLSPFSPFLPLSLSLILSTSLACPWTLYLTGKLFAKR
jgi:hypothetical protein